jgi:hypothetical protein
MLYFALRAFGFLVTNINIKITIYCSPSLLSFSILSLLFLILSSISLSSLLHISPLLSFFPSLSLLLPSRSCSLSPRPHLCNPLSFSSLTHTLSPPLLSPSPCTFSRRVVFLFSPSRKFSSVSPVSHPI